MNKETSTKCYKLLSFKLFDKILGVVTHPVCVYDLWNVVMFTNIFSKFVDIQKTKLLLFERVLTGINRNRKKQSKKKM